MSNVNYEAINQKSLFGKPPVWERTEIEKAIQFVLQRIDRNLESFADKFPDEASVGYIYPAIGNIEWTSGFWTGMFPVGLAGKHGACMAFRSVTYITETRRCSI